MYFQSQRSWLAIQLHLSRHSSATRPQSPSCYTKPRRSKFSTSRSFSSCLTSSTRTCSQVWNGTASSAPKQCPEVSCQTSSKTSTSLWSVPMSTPVKSYASAGADRDRSSRLSGITSFKLETSTAANRTKCTRCASSCSVIPPSTRLPSCLMPYRQR